MKTLFLFIIACISYVNACDVTSSLFDIPDDCVVKMHFKQTKKITGITKNLVSLGHIFLHKTKGLRWETNSPFQQIMLIDKTGIYNIVNKEKILISENINKQANMIHSFLFNILNGRFETLDMFDVTKENQNNTLHKIILTPKTDNFKLFKSITIEDQGMIKHISIQRMNGDIETIRLSNISLHTSRYDNKFK